MRWVRTSRHASTCWKNRRARSVCGCSKTCAGGPSSITRPPSRTTIRSAERRAKPSSCVTTIKAKPSAFSSSSTPSTSCFNSGSNALVISSHNSPRGSIARRAGDRHALLLAAGQLAGIGVGAVRQAHSREQFHGSLAGRGRRHAQYVDGRFHDVPRGREMGKQLKILEDHAEQAADLDHRFARRRLRAAAQSMRPDPDLARVEMRQAVDAAQQRGLAAAAGADQRHGLVRLDRQVDPVQDLPRPKTLRHSADVHLQRLRHTPFPQRFSR